MDYRTQCFVATAIIDQLELHDERIQSGEVEDDDWIASRTMFELAKRLEVSELVAYLTHAKRQGLPLPRYTSEGIPERWLDNPRYPELRAGLLERRSKREASQS